MIRAEEIEDLPPLPVWQRSITLVTGAGYKDNLLLSHSQTEESPFIKSGLELFVTRLPREAETRQFQFAVNAEDLRFLSSDSVEKEQLIFTQARVVQELGPTWETSLDLEYVYLDQVLDVSATDPLLNTVRVRGHQGQATPGLRRSFGAAGSVELTLPFARRSYSAPVDDYWESGAKLSFEHPYGVKSEWIVSFSYSYSSYDTRPQADRDGAFIPGSSLGLHQQRTELAWRHYIDPQNRWRLATKLSYRLQQDNGSGYFNNVRFQAGEQIRYRAGGWDLSAEARLAYYDYALQRVSLLDRSNRERTEVGFALRCEKQLARWLRLFAEYEFERVLSNRTLDEYSVNVATAGLAWEF